MSDTRPRPLPVALTRGAHRCWLKWHRARLRPSDAEFTALRLRQAMAAGARAEIDLIPCADGLAVLHDDDLDRSTTGGGPVAAQTGAALRRLRIRDPDGQATDQPVMLLDDLCALAAGAAAEGAEIQLDLKVSNDALSEALVQGFARAVAPVAGRFILSGGDAVAVARLADRVAGLKTGFDPCRLGPVDALRRTGDIDAFVRHALHAAGPASMIYLDHALILWADARGVDLVAPFHRAGKAVDAYTLAGAGPGLDATVARLLALGVDQITTDDAEGMAARYG